MRLIGLLQPAGAEKPPDKAWGGDVVSPATKCWIDKREKVIQVGGDDSRAVEHCNRPTVNYHREPKNCPREILDRDLGHEKGDLLSLVFLGECVGKGQDQCYYGLAFRRMINYEMLQ